MAQVKFGISSLDGLLEAGYIQKENTPNYLKPMTFCFVFATNYIFRVLELLMIFSWTNNHL